VYQWIFASVLPEHETILRFHPPAEGSAPLPSALKFRPQFSKKISYI